MRNWGRNTIYKPYNRIIASALFCFLFSVLFNILFPTITTDKLIMINSDYNTPNLDILILVNRNNPLSKDYMPFDLIVPNINNPVKEDLLLRKEAARALEELLTKANKDKIDFYCLSGYRSFNIQEQLYNEKVRSSGKVMADKYVAYPGQSEHQTGLALDIANLESVNQLLRSSFGKTQEGIWLQNNAWKFGFIIRYPKGKEKITGYSYEPWHIRYVGIKASKEMKSKDMVLEEYLEYCNE